MLVLLPTYFKSNQMRSLLVSNLIYVKVPLRIIGSIAFELAKNSLKDF